MSGEPEKGRVRIVRTSDHRSHYLTGAVPNWTQDDLRLHIYNEVVSGQGGDFHISNAQLIMSRSAAQRLLETLQGAMTQEGRARRTVVTTVPQDVALGMEKVPSTGERRKVPKIRKK